RVERLAAAADAENALAKALGRRAIEHAGFLERGERVGCEDLGPLVAVIARRVAAAENVAESAWEAVVGRRLDDGDLVADLVEQLEHAAAALRRILAVQTEVEQR